MITPLLFTHAEETKTHEKRYYEYYDGYIHECINGVVYVSQGTWSDASFTPLLDSESNVVTCEEYSEDERHL